MVVVVVPVAEHLGGVGPKAVAACAKGAVGNSVREAVFVIG